MGGSPEVSIEVETGGAATRIAVAGPLTIRTLGAAARRLDGIGPVAEARLDLGAVTRLDTAGGWLVARFRARLAEAGGRLELAGATPEMEAILTSVERAMPRPEPAPAPPRGLAERVAGLGRAVADTGRTARGLTAYLGLFLARLGRGLRHPRSFRLTALVHHCEEVGVKAVPIVALMSFLIGIVLAFQGASQLRQFGAEVFVVDLIAVSILRELGILLTAIIVAGRTASAFTAAIGSMKMREEIDAMRTLGLDPAAVLFVPRILALLIMLPILGLIANLAGLFGGALMSWLELGISPAMFRTRFLEGTDISHLTVGMVKAPVFALIIGVVGCHAGMQVGSNAESLGQQTSKAVVAAIFAVIVADALFSIFFAEIGL
ncbi:ABC transporter permease [Roseicyclus persicicus]|uniref:MlaE family lipid ABC transporter permease subunit n=1 Tax=Roseicyclus persicicus TaxID=2650661 RepID=A0A7X6H0T8_9RHOB|nr:MlaE family lipid ABC transporter permease subunit [Roseibacterium persicicum]NKX45903.1 MlaE family lipid ABC transporter permease subunit [Roseibacterium persicicum]